MKTVYNTSDKIFTEQDVLNAFNHAYYLGCSNDSYSPDKAFMEWNNEYSANTKKEVTLRSVLSVVSWHTGVSVKNISEAENKRAGVTLARQYVCWFLYHYTKMSTTDIADETMGMTHSIAIHRVDAINNMLFYSSKTKDDIERMKIKLITEGYGLMFTMTRKTSGNGSKLEEI